MAAEEQRERERESGRLVVARAQAPPETAPGYYELSWGST